MKKCVECKDRPARHWNSNLCYECFKKMLNENLTKETQHNNKEKSLINQGEQQFLGGINQ